jgi:hypothetical protein
MGDGVRGVDYCAGLVWKFVGQKMVSWYLVKWNVFVRDR